MRIGASSLRRKFEYHCDRYRGSGDRRFEWYLYFRLDLLGVQKGDLRAAIDRPDKPPQK
jgi:hypothetical protein